MNLKTLSFFFFGLFLCLGFFIFPSFSARAAQSGDYTYTTAAGKATITDYSGPGGDIIIPSTLDGYPVTAIGASAFYNTNEDKSITSVVIPEGVLTIGTDAFRWCSSLTSVTFPSTLTSIGVSAFRFSKLSSITIPDSVTSIGESAFGSCLNLTQITVGAGNTIYSSEDGVLFNKAKTSIIQYPAGKADTAYVVPASVTSLATHVFYDCQNPVSITLPDSLASMSAYPFWGCTALSQIIVGPGNLTYSSVDGVLFNKAKTSLLNYPAGKTDVNYTIPTGVTTIGTNAFSVNAFLTNLTIPTGVTTIGASAFSYCTGLVSVVIPATVTSIGSSAFYYNTSLTAVAIPAGVASIAANTFYGCSSLTSITIPDSVTSIGNFAFTYCTSLASVTIGSGVLTMGTDVFYGDTALTSIVIPNSVTSIGANAFMSCSALSAITLGTNLTSIGNYAFYSTALASVSIPDSVTTIGDNVFSNSLALVQVTVGAGNPAYASEDGVLFNKTKTTLITYPPSKPETAYVVPGGVTTISTYAFAYSKFLSSLTISDSVVTIGSNATRSTSISQIIVGDGNSAYASEDGVLFNKAKTTLITYPAKKTDTAYYVPDTVTSIGTSAFYSCTFLTSVTIGSGLSSITMPAFSRCNALTEISVVDGNVSYTSEDGVLFNKTKTTLVVYPVGKVANYTVPDGVTSIGTYAFSGSLITGVVIPNSVASIGVRAFYNCLSLASATIGEGVTSIGAYAFGACQPLSEAYFFGNAPAATANIFLKSPATVPETVIYYLNGKTGWINPWYSYTTALSPAKAITAFSLASPAVSGVINQDQKTITMSISCDTDTDSLVAIFNSTGVSIKVGALEQTSAVTANDFRAPVVYTVGAANGTFQNYTVAVSFPSGGCGAPYQAPAGIGAGGTDKAVGMGRTGDIGEISAQGINYLTYINSKAFFTVPVSGTSGLQSHQLSVDSLDLLYNTIQITIQSTPQTLSLKLGETALVDLDGDNIKDIKVTFAGIFVNRAELTIVSLPKIENEKIKELVADVSTTTLKISPDAAKPVINKPVVKFLFKRNLSIGTTGADVKELQKYLNANGFIVAKAGAGSSGKETNYFGSATKKALVEFQKHKNITPAVGYFGPVTRKSVNGN